MTFKPGNKLGEGRPKGAVNRTGLKARKAFQMLLDENIDQVREDLKSLSPYRRVEMLLKLAHFCIPKLQAVHLETWTDLSELLEMTQEERLREIKRIESILSNENGKSEG